MKFAKEFEEELVPEWRVKYFDYKTGKKKVKAVARALAKIGSQTPKAAPGGIFARRRQSATSGSYRAPDRRSSGARSADAPANGGHAHLDYGSIRAVEPLHADSVSVGPASLELPDPALSPSTPFSRIEHAVHGDENPPPIRRVASVAGDGYETGRTHTPSKLSATLLPKHRSIFRPRRTVSTPQGGLHPQQPNPLLRRLFSHKHDGPPHVTDVSLGPYREFDERDAEFTAFLHRELKKIEDFYRIKEDEATKRLEVLKAQLGTMWDRRLRDIVAVQPKKEGERRRDANGAGNDGAAGTNGALTSWMAPIGHTIGTGHRRFGQGFTALERTVGPHDLRPARDPNEGRRDFSRKKDGHEVPYRTAKRKLKLALQEYYRGLELVKSYVLLNRTAFRKINKKYDKAVRARPTLRFMTDHVDKSWFVRSGLLDQHMVAVEDLYARYFERGNHKLAVGKLRSKQARGDDCAGSVFRNGLLLAAGTLFGIEGLAYGAEQLASEDSVVAINTGYLLQLYAGYFLALLLFLLFCIDCRAWLSAKINYVFIFEFDTRHNLNWRQLAEAGYGRLGLPSLFYFLLGLAIWLNFSTHIPTPIGWYIYWPALLIGLTVSILFLPLPILYHRSRAWWAYSNFRLLLAGVFPVEFRDFLLGDMFCSLTYMMGNIEVFFCLYANHWNHPGQCNSSSSRLQGFFSTLPGIWRALQCLRRYGDTRSAFPHLVNCGKYLCTIASHASLSMYRIDKTHTKLAIFIAFSIVNSVYVSIWDLFMDWSLGNPKAKHPFLRDVLGYRNVWVYYAAMFTDPILRFNWIFYAILPNELQHSAILAFIVSLTEVFRRAMWTVFRVENEHCTNVGRFRASRDIPLPYDVVPDPSAQVGGEDVERQAASTECGRVDLAGADGEDGLDPGVRRRRTNTASTGESAALTGLRRVGTMISAAHALDFERKKRPGMADLDGSTGHRLDDDGPSSDEARA